MEKLLLAYMVNEGYGTQEECEAHIKKHGFDNVAKALGKVESHMKARTDKEKIAKWKAHPLAVKRKEVSS